MNKKVTLHVSSQIAMHGRGRERDSNHSNEGLSLLGPGVVCPGSFFFFLPGTLLEMSAAGNWIRLAIRVEPRLTDAQTGGDA